MRWQGGVREKRGWMYAPVVAADWCLVLKAKRMEKGNVTMDDVAERSQYEELDTERKIVMGMERHRCYTD